MAPVQPMVPDHELIRRIGGGSYGDVYLARNVVGTWRAVKVVFRDRFTDARPYEREFNGMLTFEPLSRSNEAFIDILQIGRNDAEGYFYYVMELADDATEKPVESSELRVEGEAKGSQKLSTLNFQPSTYVPKTLSKALLQRGRLPLDECLELGLTLNLGLAHLHRAGLIHRDIKPSNIIFVGGVPKLADIGLVIETSEARSYVGTEGFIPPEGPNSPQADLFSLGKVLYEAGMGKDRKDFPEPFTQLAESPDATALLEFNAILLKACAANVKERYQSAEEMNADLALLQSGGSVRRQRMLAGQLRFVQRAGALVTVLASVIALGWWWQARQTRLVQRLAEEKSTLATEKTTLADNLAQLGAENRQRIVRLDIANGVRLLDEGDPAGALLWFADALPLVTNNAAETSIHRIRIQQTLNQLPRPVQFLTHDQAVKSMGFSPDGTRFITSTESGWVHVWDAHTGAPVLKPFQVNGDTIREARFTRDGQRLLVRSQSSQVPRALTATIFDAATGQKLFSKAATNLARMHFMSDGRWLAAARLDHVIEVLDVRDGSRVAALKGHTKEITELSSSSNVLISASADGTVRVWRLPSGESIRKQLSFSPPLPPIVLSRDGQFLATRDEFGSDEVANIGIWRTDTLTSVGKPIASRGGGGTIQFLDSGAGGRLLDTFGGRIRVLDVETQTELFPPIRLDPLNAYGGFFDVSRDGRRFIMGGGGGIDGVWSLETGEMLAPPFQHGRQIADIALSPDGSQFGTLTDNGACALWNVNLRQEEAIHRLRANLISSHSSLQNRLDCFSPDRTRLLIPTADRTVRLVEVERMMDQELRGVATENAVPHHCVFAPDGRQWAIAYAPTNELGGSFVELWRHVAGNLQSQVIPHPRGTQDRWFALGIGMSPSWRDETGPWFRGVVPTSQAIKSLIFSPDGASLLTVGGDRQIRIWRTSDGTLLRSVALPESFEWADLFPDGRTAFVVDRNRGFGCFDLLTGGFNPTPAGPGPLTTFAFDSSRERFATADWNDSVRVWNAKTGAPLGPPVRYGSVVTRVDWSPDGQHIAMAGLLPEVRVWDPDTGELFLPPLRLGNLPLQSVAWSLDGRFLVARSDENVVRVWDAATGEPVTPLLKHDHSVLLAQLAPNNRLITLSRPNVLRAWDLTETHLSVDVIADYAKLVSGRRLSANAVMLPLKHNDLAELSRSLRGRAPQLFE